MAETGGSSDSVEGSHLLKRSSSTTPPKHPDSIADLSISLSDKIDLLASELRARWKSGQRIDAEQISQGRFAEAWKSVAQDDEHLLDLLYHEILIRQEFGDRPECQKFVNRFPRLKDRIERLFAVHTAIEDDDWDEVGGDVDKFTSSDGHSSEVASASPEQSASSRLTPNDATPQWPRRSRSKFIAEPPPGYELLDELGRGGMAVVYRARQQILDRIVALKMLLGGGLASAEVLSRIRQEARAVAQLQHPGIVQIYEVGEHNGLPYLSLEYVPGGTLHDWLKGQPLPPMDACRIVEQLAAIAQFAHERGIVHRDLKPANVLLTERPDPTRDSRTDVIDMQRSSISSSMSLSVKIGDFGLARIQGHQSHLTATGQIIGTPSYMSPEQAAGSSVDTVSPAQDVYSLGAILFELLTGRPPFRGATLFDTLEQVRTDEPVPPRRLQPRVPADLETVCLKCLEKSPERRYSTAQQLADDLRAIQQGQSIKARPASRGERFRKLILRHPTVSAMALLTFVVVVTGIGAVLRENSRASQERDRALELSIAYGRERDEAQEQRRLAEQQRMLAEAARSEAVVSRQQAETSLDHALTAISSLSQFGMELRQTPQQQKTSRRILEETLKLYDQLEQSQGSSTRLRRQLAFTLVRAGEIQSMLRESTKANDALRRGVSLLQEELAGNKDDKELWRFLSYATWVQGNLLKDTGRLAEAIEAYNQSLNSVKEEIRLAPASIDLMRGKANILTNICALKVAERRLDEAIPIFDEAISILRGLVQKNPEDAGSQSELALVLHDYSSALFTLNRTDDANRYFDESFSIRDNEFRKRPQDHGTRVLFSRLYMSRGGRFQRSKRYADARTEYVRAVDLLNPVVEAFPTIFEYQQAMLNAVISQLNCSIAGGDDTGAESLWSELTARLTQCRATFAEERQVVGLMQIWFPDRIEWLVEQGREAEAAKLHDTLIQSSEWLVSNAAAEIEPRPTEKQRARWRNTFAWYLTIAPTASFRNPKRSIALIHDALVTEPNDANNLHTLATALYYDNQLSESLKVMEQAILNLPPDQLVEQRDPMFPAVLAMIHAGLGDPESARRQIELLPPSPQGLSKDGPHLRRVFAEARKVVESQQAGSVK